MKKLDKLIITAFAGPFLLTFAVVEFIFLTQVLLKYLDDIVGKDLGIAVILKLLFFLSVTIVPISLPLAVLLSSLMTYGNLGEHHELTAIKASGIALTRILRPVWLVSLVLGGIAFWFNNSIVPKANLNAYSLLWDVRQKKLALDIREGVFYMIYDHTQKSGNATVMLADSGRMFTRFGGQYLGLELFRGHNYIEQPDARDRSASSFVRQGFKRNMITFSLSSFNLNNTKKELFQTNRMMLNIPQLFKAADSVQKVLANRRRMVPLQLSGYYTYLRFDTLNQAAYKRVVAWQVPLRRLAPLTPAMVEQASNRARNIASFMGSTSQNLFETARDSAEFRIEIYRKYTQSVAVILMFLIGAPLGAIIKKGGLGVPILISILFFIVYYVLSILGEKGGREFEMPVGMGMWLSNAILLPAGLFFLYQAYNDSGLLETDFWRRMAQRLPRFPRLRRLAMPVPN
ncbi:MAG: YjgP/YjgQ family permease [Cytophagaceae bacterium]|nr:MAG: YjgP/YjgQ family permease [Cytophagaceae bacterium]